MGESGVELQALADHVAGRREAILEIWRKAIDKDPSLTAGNALPRADLFDHIPALLRTFEGMLRSASSRDSVVGHEAAHKSAAAHGLQRWQQGYDLREVTRELGKLNECVVSELDRYTQENPSISHGAISAARRRWAALCTMGIEESVDQYFQLQQQEATGHVKDLEHALAGLRELEREQADLWRQAAHDLRGNLGVVANATVGLTHSGLRDTSRDEFVRILMRNVTSLHHLLDDVTSLARLQAGRETRHIEPLDASQIFQQLCEGIRPLAQQRRLFLRCDGPPGYAADGDAVKIRRIAQNLILNAVKFTVDGGISVNWGDSDAQEGKRWELTIKDTGPGFPVGSAKPLAAALESAPSTIAPRHAGNAGNAGNALALREESGEGLGLSIVKRLCDLLDATIEVTSVEGKGTTFRILFPRHYPSA